MHSYNSVALTKFLANLYDIISINGKFEKLYIALAEKEITHYKHIETYISKHEYIDYIA